MANITPNASTFSDVYQLETSDFVQGGAGGTANRQAQDLANRTEWLKTFRTPIGSVLLFPTPQQVNLNALLPCDGRNLQISQYPELYDACKLIFGTTYNLAALPNTVDADLATGTEVRFWNNTGSGPTTVPQIDFLGYTSYWLRNNGAGACTIHTSLAGATGNFGSVEVFDDGTAKMHPNAEFPIPNIPSSGITGLEYYIKSR